MEKKIVKWASSISLKGYYGSLDRKAAVKKKTTCYLKNYITALFTLLEKVRANCEFRF